MKNSKILKSICYILIPILVLIMLVSVSYETVKNSFKKEIEEGYSFFETETFLHDYMYSLVDAEKDLIYKNNNYKSLQDGNIKICYDSDSYEYYNYYNYYTKLKNYYYIILYNDLALTNVELTTETNTVEKIKNYIFSQDGKKANIINGNVEADSEMIQTKALQYFEAFENTYYTVVQTDDSKSIATNIEEYTTDLESNIDNSNMNTMASPENIREYHTTKIEDFQIYTTYLEEIIENKDDVFLKNIVNELSPYENQLINAIPICTIILIIIIIYLLSSIGYTKNTDEIDINRFDRIPIEIIVILTAVIVCLIVALIFEGIRDITEDYYKFTISMILSGYFICYILCLLTFITIIKRFKAKIFIKTSITGKILKWCINLFKKIIVRIRTIVKALTMSWSITFKVIIGIIIYVIGSIILIAILGPIGVCILIATTCYILYKIIVIINCHKKIENHLKNIYEGNDYKKLEQKDFSPIFHNLIKYINDISSGFENAIQEGLKSERLKTELITNVSHDIKTPLTSIINYVDLIKKENLENEKVQEYIDILDNKSQRLKKLTEDLVEASKASSGNVKLNMEKINISELIKQTTGEFEDKFKEKNLSINLKIPNEEIYINADNRYIYRIIENLFTNISKYALESSRVYIDVEKSNNKVKIIIKNISKEQLNISSDELMQRFVRGDKSRTTEGSGLGISISKSLTEIQKGKFNLQIDGDLFKVELIFDVI